MWGRYNKSLPKVLKSGNTENWEVLTLEEGLSDDFPSLIKFMIFLTGKLNSSKMNKF